MSEQKPVIVWPLRQSGDGLYENGVVMRIVACLNTKTAAELAAAANAGHEAVAAIAELEIGKPKAEHDINAKSMARMRAQEKLASGAEIELLKMSVECLEENVVTVTAERDAAVAECERLKAQLDDSWDLVRHCWIHSGYMDCGYIQMASDQKALFDSITGRTNQ